MSRNRKEYWNRLTTPPLLRLRRGARALWQFIHTFYHRANTNLVGRETVEQSGAASGRELLHAAALRRVDRIP